ncbi:MAG TPA: alkaline phosphatase family protein, partial [Candidatus Dormibacteraeota bacterium]|nr:alkaline phosphatase family protein [Candidatus Dormibacteraeota bacterium]
MPRHPSRRDVLRAGALGAGAFTLARSGLVQAVVDAMAAVPAGPARLSDIEHVIVLMQENRSFDHYF